MGMKGVLVLQSYRIVLLSSDTLLCKGISSEGAQ